MSTSIVPSNTCDALSGPVMNLNARSMAVLACHGPWMKYHVSVTSGKAMSTAANHRISRRQALQGAAAVTVAGPFAPAARAQDTPLPRLPNLPPSDALLLQPSDAAYATYEPAA